MITKSSWEIERNGDKLLLLLLSRLNVNRISESKKAVIEYITDAMTEGYQKFKRIIIRIKELNMKENEKNLEEEDLYRGLTVENENKIVALDMGFNAAAEQGEEDPDGDIDVEDDTRDGYRDDEDAE
jgi:hypothetical protein